MTATSRLLLLSAAGIVTLLIGACGDQPKDAETKPGPSLPETYWLAAPPANAQPIAKVFADAKSGDEVVAFGDVGGMTDVFIAGRALFPLVDSELKDCIERGDGCSTPWDFCCEPADSLAKNTATVEFHDEQGLRKLPVRHFHGLDHLSRVYVKGTARRDDKNNLTIVASGIHVAKK